LLFELTCAKYPKCHSGDNDCLPRTINEILRKSKKGIAELNLPPTDPLYIPTLSIIQGPESSISINLHFKDINFYGISDAIVSKTIGFEKKLLPGSKYEVHARIPRVEMIAKYNIAGRVLVLPITGNGKSNLTLSNVDIKVKFAPTLIEKNGKQHINIPANKFKLAFDTTRMYLKLDNLFNGDKALGDTMNMFLNENWKDILQELKPAVREAFAQVLTGLINPVFEKIPYEELFSDSDISN